MAHVQGADARQHLPGQAVPFQGEHGLGQHHVFHPQAQAAGDLDLHAGPKHHFAGGALGDCEATSEGEQAQIPATQADQGVGFGDALVVQRKRS